MIFLGLNPIDVIKFVRFQLDLATGGKGGIGNYIGICVFVAAFGVADAHVQGGLVGDLSFMCPEFIQVRFVAKACCFSLLKNYYSRK